MERKLVIISAPSGAGKTTIAKHLLKNNFNLAFSISATTRPSRGDEQDGVDYYFLTPAEFRKKVENDEFIEWEEVYNGIQYGTLKSEVKRLWAKGHHVLFDVDVEGAINLKKLYKTNSISIFIMPPSVEELENRLIKRGTDSEENIRSRVEKAKDELSLANQFDTVIINHRLDRAMEEAFKTVKSFLGA